jgi:hypothetical protein
VYHLLGHVKHLASQTEGIGETFNSHTSTSNVEAIDTKKNNN